MSSPDAAAGAPGARLTPSAIFLIALVPFLVLATANSAGYRYGASDQAFYVPAVLEAMNPALFPRDSHLIASQARLTLFDEVIGGAARATGLALPVMLALFQVMTLGLLAWGVIRIGDVFYRTRWARRRPAVPRDAAARDQQVGHEHARRLLPSAPAGVCAGHHRRGRVPARPTGRRRGSCSPSPARSIRRPRCGSRSG